MLLFSFNDTATTEIYTLSLHDALPIWAEGGDVVGDVPDVLRLLHAVDEGRHGGAVDAGGQAHGDVLGGRAAAEGPPLGQVRRFDRAAPVVLQLGPRRPVRPPLGPVALVALD